MILTTNGDEHSMPRDGLIHRYRWLLCPLFVVVVVMVVVVVVVVVDMVVVVIMVIIVVVVVDDVVVFRRTTASKRTRASFKRTRASFTKQLSIPSLAAGGSGSGFSSTRSRTRMIGTTFNRAITQHGVMTRLNEFFSLTTGATAIAWNSINSSTISTTSTSTGTVNIANATATATAPAAGTTSTIANAALWLYARQTIIHLPSLHASLGCCAEMMA